MIAALDIVLPLFALMVCGYLAVYLRILGSEGIKGLANFIFFFAIPALLFRGMVNAKPVEHDQVAIIYPYFIGSLTIFFVTMLSGRLLFRLTLAERAVMGFTGSFSNTVLLGIPIIYTAFGEAGVLPVTIITSFHSIILLSLATALVEIGLGQRGAALRHLPRTMAALLKNPLLAAILAGFAARLVGWRSPQALDSFLGLLTNAAAPCSLFALGATLATFSIGKGKAETLFLILVKMVAHPLLVWLLVTKVFALAPLQIAVATILAALPSGNNGFILAQRYGVYLERTASTVLITTAVSVVTVSLLVAHYAATLR
jgi:malonate transporter